MFLQPSDSERLYGTELGRGSKVTIDGREWRWAPDGQRYLRDFTSPYELIHYESLYDSSSNEEASILLNDGLAPEIEWDVYHS
jgi:hypothetical protein